MSCSNESKREDSDSSRSPTFSNQCKIGSRSVKSLNLLANLGQELKLTAQTSVHQSIAPRYYDRHDPSSCGQIELIRLQPLRLRSVLEKVTTNGRESLVLSWLFHPICMCRGRAAGRWHRENPGVSQVFKGVLTLLMLSREWGSGTMSVVRKKHVSIPY